MAPKAREAGTMDVRQLRQFLAVVDHGSVHRAAQHLFVAQPSVTQTIRRLESDLGTELFIRRGRGLVLSPSGVALVGPAREVVRALDVARETVAAVDGLRGGRLRIASMPSQVVSPLTGLVASFVERYPGVQVAVGAAPRPDDVREALRRGFAEVGVVATGGPTEALTDLDRLPLETQSFVLVAHNDADLASRRRDHRRHRLSDRGGDRASRGSPAPRAERCRGGRGRRLVAPTGRCRGPAGTPPGGRGPA
jgi:DNA-binding transcriptional LysR family regulator